MKGCIKEERMEGWIKELCPEIADWKAELIAEAFQKRVAVEREACAKVCEDASKTREGEMHSDAQWAGLVLSAAIRARGNT
jgi:hypothetical protein